MTRGVAMGRMAHDAVIVTANLDCPTLPVVEASTGTTTYG
jgi:hypothetical protein